MLATRKMHRGAVIMSERPKWAGTKGGKSAVKRQEYPRCSHSGHDHRCIAHARPLDEQGRNDGFEPKATAHSKFSFP